jgi:hypothetical protein
MKKVVAKGKKKRFQLDAEQELADELTKAQATVRKSEIPSPQRADVSTKEMLNVLADELQEIYAEYGHNLDRVNAMDKMTYLLRELRFKEGGVRIKEKSFSPRWCKEHG